MIFFNWDFGFCIKECYVVSFIYLRVFIKFEFRGFLFIFFFFWVGLFILYWLIFIFDMEDLELKLEVEVFDNFDVFFMIFWKLILLILCKSFIFKVLNILFIINDSIYFCVKCNDLLGLI